MVLHHKKLHSSNESCRRRRSEISIALENFTKPTSYKMKDSKILKFSKCLFHFHDVFKAFLSIPSDFPPFSIFVRETVVKWPLHVDWIGWRMMSKGFVVVYKNQNRNIPSYFSTYSSKTLQWPTEKWIWTLFSLLQNDWKTAGTNTGVRLREVSVL